MYAWARGWGPAPMPESVHNTTGDTQIFLEVGSDTSEYTGASFDIALRLPTENTAGPGKKPLRSDQTLTDNCFSR